MSGLSRREFISGAASAGAIFSVPGCRDNRPAPGNPIPPEGLVIPLCGEWSFRTDPENKGENESWQSMALDAADWMLVRTPHTWQVREDTAGYMGAAWYRREFDLPELPDGAVIRAEFEAVYHSAKVWVNGQPAGEHLRKGYTALTLDLTSSVRAGERNTLAVRVDNSFDERMLPFGKSFDWTVDGGIYRPARLLITGPLYIETLSIRAIPDDNFTAAKLEPALRVCNAAKASADFNIECRIVDESSGLTVLRLPAMEASLETGAARDFTVPQAVLENPRLWHFDHPGLYRIEACLVKDGRPVHSLADTFGVRRFEVRGTEFLLNGEPVRLMGVERMGGSHPLYGMAEPEELIRRDHAEMKELNCVFSRVHWQQDRRVLDWCDRNGILIQIEVPCWGPATFNGMGDRLDPVIMANGLEQLEEMIRRDSNHPSVVTWGLCNEIDGQNPVAAEFARRMYERARELDPGRLLTYASNSLQKDPGTDISRMMDFVEWNEYYESWMEGTPADMRRNLEAIHAAFPDKPVVISEYGYCECRPAHSGGDPKRIEILRVHDSIFRDYPWVAGAIFFCYNDYRTHIGDKGEDRMKQRVHGVVDLYGEHKPSWEILQAESSPVESFSLTGRAGSLEAVIRLRNDLPSYSLRGYVLRWVVYGFGGLPMESHEIALPDLSPGQEYRAGLAFSQEDPLRVKAEIVRPTGFTVLSTEWKS